MKIQTDWPRPAEILLYYQRSKEALDDLKKKAAGAASPESLFYGMTQQEVEQALQQMAQERDHEETLLLTASFEAIFQVDRLKRILKKKKDSVSRKLRNLRAREKAQKSRWIKVEDILDVWSKETG